MKWVLEIYRADSRNDAQTIKIIQDVIRKMDGAQIGATCELTKDDERIIEMQ